MNLLPDSPTFHFFTLVTKDDQYAAMRDSLGKVGFNERNSIFTILDNRNGNANEPFSAITAAVRQAEAPYVVFCHQDLIFYHGPDKLLDALRAVEAIDPKWAVAGNTGHTARYELAICLDHPGEEHQSDILPVKVLSLDENFLVIRRDSQVGCSPGLSGFHHYGTDLVLNAYLKGFSAWVIDYRLLHTGTSLDYVGLHQQARPFRRVWGEKIHGGIVVTPSMTLIFSPLMFLFSFGNRVGMHRKILSRPRMMSTLEYLHRRLRPSWLPTVEFEDGNPRRPHLNFIVRALDRALNRRRGD